MTRDPHEVRAAHNAAVMARVALIEQFEKIAELALIGDVVVGFCDPGTTEPRFYKTAKYSPERGHWIEDGQCARPRADGKPGAHLRVVR